ncbi:MAG: hypothetical protein J4F41_07075 [Alphaproteobacteria bacterium]|nr:hypothetical protein [Alphaproteobacteria bacterium]
MADDPKKFFNLSGMSWVLYALLAVMLITGLVMSQGRDAPEWAKCKESLLQQMFSDTCTPAEGFGVIKTIPASPGQDI